MLLISIRLGCLLATLVASLHVAAAPRFWTLTGVQFSDGTFATGYFSYDDALKTIANWNVRVTSSWFSFPASTYVPGNSMASVVNPYDYDEPPNLAFVATMGVPGPYFGARQLQIALIAALDGSNATVLLDILLSREDFPSLDPPRGRSITRGSLTHTPVPPSIVIAQVDEFYDAGLRHYFITADAAEKQDLDTGVHPGWVRTGESFKAYATGSSAGGTINPVCRYYSDPDQEFYGPGADSHFFSADAGECLTVFRKYASGFWSLENDNAFQINLPDTATGTCPGGTIPVYRLWNQRADSNHRYTTRAAIKTQMLAAGYLAEGYGADGVVMCAVQ
jgi:hypothetical protein